MYKRQGISAFLSTFLTHNVSLIVNSRLSFLLIIRPLSVGEIGISHSKYQPRIILSGSDVYLTQEQGRLSVAIFGNRSWRAVIDSLVQ